MLSTLVELDTLELDILIEALEFVGEHDILASDEENLLHRLVKIRSEHSEHSEEG